MAEYTGKGMTISVAGGTALDGITKVEINDEGAPAAEQLDSTASADATYTTIPQPLGGKGAPKATVKITLQDSAVSYTDNKATKLAPNVKAALTFAASATSNDDKYDHATMELIDRTTTITWAAPIATIVLTYAANTNGTWGSVT
jgi:hypothetical protein